MATETGASDEQIREAAVALGEHLDGPGFDQTDESFLEAVEEVAPFLVPPTHAIVERDDLARLLAWAMAEDGHETAEFVARMRGLLAGEGT